MYNDKLDGDSGGTRCICPFGPITGNRKGVPPGPTCNGRRCNRTLRFSGGQSHRLFHGRIAAAQPIGNRRVGCRGNSWRDAHAPVKFNSYIITLRSKSFIHSKQLNEPFRKPYKPSVCMAFFLFISVGSCSRLKTKGNTCGESSFVYYPADKKRSFVTTNSL